jgi:hypothetical protein
MKLGRGYRLCEGAQIPTRPTTIVEIMSHPSFVLGVADARAGRGYHKDYDLWTGNMQWCYERARQWAALTPKNVPLKLDGKINPNAVAWYARHRDDII